MAEASAAPTAPTPAPAPIFVGSLLFLLFLIQVELETLENIRVSFIYLPIISNISLETPPAFIARSDAEESSTTKKGILILFPLTCKYCKNSL